MPPTIIDGKVVSAAVELETKRRVAALLERGVTPGLAVVLVGDDPASQSYVSMKERDCERVGIRGFDTRLPADTTQEELDAVIAAYNADLQVHGILVQQPFPRHLDVERVVADIAPIKDVDGFHPENLGRLMRGLPGHRACTPWGVIRMLDHYGIELRGKHAVIVGRSLLVGKPMGLMLLERDCTVTTCHSRTVDLAAVCRGADILVAAIGRPKMIGAEYVREGAVVIDVGINRTDSGMVGDVDFDAVAPMCSAITPVPGGVGPMTRAMLMSNTADAAEQQTV
ncbi:MAG TPA: bifunctional methylenetetrahydrofolate dehydrogenase/methenyltetrahydrofolate cyclohydrolase FolD [Coriobacteriia bacterium]